MLSRLFTILFLAFSLMLLSACEREEEAVQPLPITFDVTAKEVKAFSATLVITHTGTNRMEYLGIIVEGHGVEALDTISKYLMNNGIEPDDAMTQRKKQIVLNDLMQQKDYTYIVFAVEWNSGAFEYAGCYKAFEFTTAVSEFQATVYDKWTITYVGESYYNSIYMSKLHVNVQSGTTEHFFPRVYKVGYLSEFNNVENLISHALWDYMNTHNSDDDEDFWLVDQMLSNQSTNYLFYLTPGDYEAWLIGVDAEGNPTGHYAKSDAFHVDEYTMTNGYANMLGTWTVTDSAGKHFDVVFTKNEINRSFKVRGWGGENIPFYVRFDASTNGLTVKRQLVSENIIRKINGQDMRGDLYFVGWYYDDGYRLTSVDNIALGRRQSASLYRLEPGFYLADANGNEIPCSKGLFYRFVTEEDGNYYFSSTLMTFPITMTKK